MSVVTYAVGGVSLTLLFLVILELLTRTVSETLQQRLQMESGIGSVCEGNTVSGG